MHDKGLDPLKFVDRCYHKEVYVQSYSVFIQPMPNIKMIPEGSNPPVEPPPIKPLPGRPKRNRRKPRDELKKYGKLSKAGSKQSCSYCKGPNHNKNGCKKRKADAGQQPLDSTMEFSTCSNTRAPSLITSIKEAAQNSKGKTVATSTSSQGIPKRRKLPTSRALSSRGVFVFENTSWTCLQSRRPENERVLMTSSSEIKSSAVVTGDLGFQPTTRKWKGKEIVTQGDLVAAGAKKHVGIRIRAANLRESQTQPIPPTEAQKKRAAANKALAEKRLAARNQPSISQPTVRMTSSKSSSQSNPYKEWKY